MLGVVVASSSSISILWRLALGAQFLCLGIVSADGASKIVVWIGFVPLVALLSMLIFPSWIASLLMVDLRACEDHPHTMLVSAGVFILLMLVVGAVTWICTSLCCVAAIGTLRSDCCRASVVVIEHMIHLFSLIFRPPSEQVVPPSEVVALVMWWELVWVTCSPLVFLTCVVHACHCCW